MSCTGTILLPALPTVAVGAHNAGVAAAGEVGVVCDLPARADDGSYILRRTTAGPANLDAYFYEDDDGKPGRGCTFVSSTDGDPLIDDPAPADQLVITIDAREEDGRICPNEQQARWAVIVLRTGVFQSFVFEWRPGRRAGRGPS